MSLRPEASSAALAGDEAITATRIEEKYLVRSDGCDALASELSQRLTPHRFRGEGANRLPGAQHYVTTIYFDTPSRAHFLRALEDPAHNIKLRAKEYYDLHPSLAELATDPAQIVRYQPFLWFELKRREGNESHKTRFRIRKRDVPALFAGELAPPELAPIVEYCRALGQPLAASSVVNYRRASFQDEGAELRVTLDRELAFYAPPQGLWSRERALVRGACGELRGHEARVVLEVKRRAAMPEWLARALASAGAEALAFSKFVRAEQAVHGA